MVVFFVTILLALILAGLCCILCECMGILPTDTDALPVRPEMEVRNPVKPRPRGKSPITARMPSVN